MIAVKHEEGMCESVEQILSLLHLVISQLLCEHQQLGVSGEDVTLEH